MPLRSCPGDLLNRLSTERVLLVDLPLVGVSEILSLRSRLYGSLPLSALLLSNVTALFSCSLKFFPSGSSCVSSSLYCSTLGVKGASSGFLCTPSL